MGRGLAGEGCIWEGAKMEQNQRKGGSTRSNQHRPEAAGHPWMEAGQPLSCRGRLYKYNTLFTEFL